MISVSEVNAASLLASQFGAVPNQWLQVPGALMLLAAFALLIFKRVSPYSPVYTGFNLLGGATLAYEAWRTDQLGFLLLEGTWAAIAAFGFGGWLLSILGRTHTSERRESDPLHKPEDLEQVAPETGKQRGN